jgi:predicted HNH restriction endonuclease
MKLEIELVPRQCWGINIRKMLGKDWETISKRVRRDHNYTCQICGWEEDRKNGKYTHCHEVWDYDDDNDIQRLTGFECLCPNCHAVHHWGHSKSIGRDMAALKEHAIAVNGCSEEDWDVHILEQSEIWSIRSYSDRDWTTEL